jgi:hypothetical protein
MFDIGRVLISLSEKRPIFHSEADFQHSLAWELREHYPGCQIRLETKVHGAGTKVYLDILCEYQGRKYAIELKYKTLAFDCFVNGEQFYLSNQGAQDTGRYDVLKDIQRLEEMVLRGVADEGTLIFLTNDKSYYIEPGKEMKTVDQDFRIHHGKTVNGQLRWGEQTGKGTMKNREEPIQLEGSYRMNWQSYSNINNTSKGELRYLLIPVQQFGGNVFGTVIQEAVEAIPIVHKEHTNKNMNWFEAFSQNGKIPNSQRDLRDKLTEHLREFGFSIQTDRVLGKDKIDIWAEKESEILAIEVRFKTALLQTIYQAQHIQLKNQGAQDISKYDYISDLGKIERVVKNRPNVKGYALLLTNDHLYWQQPRKENTVDEAFHIHDGHVVTGTCTWKDKASKGTTAGREQPIHFTKSHMMKWKPYLSLGKGKNEEFQSLLVEVNQDKVAILQ